MSKVPVAPVQTDPKTRKRVVAIDGPAGAGKSTVARALAAALGWSHLDTGAMFRAVTLRLLESGLDAPFCDTRVAGLLASMRIVMDEAGHVSVDGVDVTARLREPRVDAAVSAVAALGAVRRKLCDAQRAFAEGRAVVAEGRDIGTVVFPDAGFKIWLDASVEERARRRHADFVAAGREASVLAVGEDIRRRDQSDASRAIAPLQRATDAIVVDTTGLSVAQVVERLQAIVRAAGGSR
ncbi:MAG: (d)CMP kinase [Planctomycetota bacterium]